MRLINLRRRHDQIAIPVPVGVQRHELNETHHKPAIASEFGKGLDFIVVDPTHQNRIHFRGRKTPKPVPPRYRASRRRMISCA